MVFRLARHLPVRLCIIALSVVALAGCAGRKQPVETGVVTLTFYNYATPEFLKLYHEDLIPAFERAHPNIKIVMNESLGDQGYDAKLLTLIAGHIAPDLIHVTQQNFPFYAAKDVLLPLDDFIREDEAFDESRYYPQVLDGLRHQDRLLGLPSDFSSIVMLYNQDLFDKYGVPYPKPDWTWEDYLETARKLTIDVDGDGHTDIFGTANPNAYNRWPAWVWMNGGEIMNEDRTRCTMDMPESVAGLQFYVDLSAKYHVAPTPGQSLGMDFEDLFASRNVAMIADSRYAYKRFLRMRGLRFRWDLAHMPKGKTRATTFIWGGNCILRSTKYPKEAWEFLKFLSGPEAARINLEAGNALPAWREAAEDAVMRPTDPKVPKHDIYYLESIAYGRTAPFPPQFAEYNAAMTHLQDSYLGLRTVEDACGLFTNEVNQALAGNVF